MIAELPPGINRSTREELLKKGARIKTRLRIDLDPVVLTIPLRVNCFSIFTPNTG